MYETEIDTVISSFISTTSSMYLQQETQYYSQCVSEQIYIYHCPQSPSLLFLIKNIHPLNKQHQILLSTPTTTKHNTNPKLPNRINTMKYSCKGWLGNPAITPQPTTTKTSITPSPHPQPEKRTLRNGASKPAGFYKETTLAAKSSSGTSVQQDQVTTSKPKENKKGNEGTKSDKNKPKDTTRSTDPDFIYIDPIREGPRCEYDGPLYG
jgi:hypothetical protein